jgi:hypothetical protein
MQGMSKDVVLSKNNDVAVSTSSAEVLPVDLRDDRPENGLWVDPVKPEMREIYNEGVGSFLGEAKLALQFTLLPVSGIAIPATIFSPATEHLWGWAILAVSGAAATWGGAGAIVYNRLGRRFTEKKINLDKNVNDDFRDWVKTRYGVVPVERDYYRLKHLRNHFKEDVFEFYDVDGFAYMVKMNRARELYVVPVEKDVKLDMNGQVVEGPNALMKETRKTLKSGVLPVELKTVWEKVVQVSSKLKGYELTVEQAHDVDLLLGEATTAVDRFEAICGLVEHADPASTVVVLESVLAHLTGVQEDVAERLLSEVEVQKRFVLESRSSVVSN